MKEIKEEDFQKTYIVNCVISTHPEYGKYFDHFGIHESTVSLYGKEVNDIIKVEVSIAKEQNVENINEGGPDYWGWYDNEDETFSLIYAQRFLLNMCFPYGIDASVDAGQGKDYRLNITQI
jgi:hypothetical protein